MSWSFGEVRALVTKAARGIGMPWGLAEETGFAVSWLEERGAPGVAAFAEYAETIQAYEVEHCPIAVGAMVSDSNDWQIAFPKVLFQPVLLIPFLASVVQSDSIMLKWDAKTVVVNNTGISGSTGSELLGVGPHECRAQGGAISSLSTYRLPRVQPNRKSHITILEKFAHRTYAPSTEESRAKGAGAGLNDND